MAGNKVSAVLEKRVLEKVESSIQTIEDHYKIKMRRPKVLFNVRGTVGGYANYNTWTVRFNPVLLTENVEDYLETTVPHEVAHLACDQIYPGAHNRGSDPFAGITFTRSGRMRRAKREVHGPRWQSIMRVLGADPSRCHTYDTTNARVRNKTTYEYVCSSCGKEYNLGPKRHAKAQRGIKYWHPGCGNSSYPLVRKGTATPKPIVQPVYVQPQQTPIQPDAGSKFDQCLKIYKSNKDRLFKQDMIDLFIKQAGCTPAGASTYYYKCKATVA